MVGSRRRYRRVNLFGRHCMTSGQYVSLRCQFFCHNIFCCITIVCTRSSRRECSKTMMTKAINIEYVRIRYRHPQSCRYMQEYATRMNILRVFYANQPFIRPYYFQALAAKYIMYGYCNHGCSVVPSEHRVYYCNLRNFPQDFKSFEEE